VFTLPAPIAESIATLGIDIGKNVFHLIGLDKRGSIVLRQKLSRSQIEVRLANLPICMIQIIQSLAEDWRRLQERVDAVSSEIETIAKNNTDCQRLMTVPASARSSQLQ
jgi:transposase